MFILGLLIPPGDKSFFLFGPRGTGKSTWVRERFPGAVYLDLLDSSLLLMDLRDTVLEGAVIRSRAPLHR